MLRQVFVLKNNEIMFSYIFGTAFSSQTLAQVKETLADFIKDPVEGTIFNRPLFNFQVVYAGIQKLFFLFVVDQSDRPEYVKEVLKPTAAKFLTTFPILPGDLKDSEKQNVFEQYLLDVHKNLHPKIALVGPLGAGKTTLAQLNPSRGSSERTIMNFAKLYPVQIRKFTFDVWDWIFPDVFSPLWNNFVRGSDVVIVVIDSTLEGVKGTGQFLTLHQREAKSARIAVVCNKQDQPGALTPENINEQVGIPTYGLSATNPQAKFQFVAILEQILDLKKPLPAEFKRLVISANEAIGQENFEKAITDLEKLVVIAQENQEMAYFQTLQDKLILIKPKLVDKKKREEIEARKFKAPEIHTFTQKVEVKALTPAPSSLPPKPIPASIPAPVVVSKPVLPSPSATSPPIGAKPILVRDTRTQFPDVGDFANKSQGPVGKPMVFSSSETDTAKISVPENERPDVQALAQKLTERIRSLGCAFSMANSSVFIEKMIIQLGRAPNNNELEKAAQALVAQVKRVKPSP